MQLLYDFLLEKPNRNKTRYVRKFLNFLIKRGSTQPVRNISKESSSSYKKRNLIPTHSFLFD